MLIGVRQTEQPRMPLIINVLVHRLVGARHAEALMTAFHLQLCIGLPFVSQSSSVLVCMLTRIVCHRRAPLALVIVVSVSVYFFLTSVLTYYFILRFPYFVGTTFNTHTF